jgi:FkbM family methyltransferase
MISGSPIRHAFDSLLERLRSVTSPAYLRERRELRRLLRLPRRQPGETCLLGRPIRFVDGASFVSAYTQIFERRVYDFRKPDGSPFIIDGGANIGLATLFWKRRFPGARVLAFEPDPAAFDALVRNRDRWRLSDVECVRAALWSSEGEMAFAPDGADAGRVVGTVRNGPSTAARAVRLRDWLERDVDLLKLDVEGSEQEILRDCADGLGAVKRVFVEWHSYRMDGQALDEILAILRRAGFRYHLQPELSSKTPFLKLPDDAGMDQRINVFAFREAP